MLGLDEVVEWDLITWSRAVEYWGSVFARGNLSGLHGLELGARNGGLSCYFAVEHGCRMTCTDIDLSGSTARELHRKHGVGDFVTYEEVDARELPYEDGRFDFVVFKSILGVVGSKGRRDRQAQAIHEISRVLRPGGMLLFAENLRGSSLHSLARRWFVPWGVSWTYVSREELGGLLGDAFGSHELRSTGLASAFVPKPEWLRSFVAKVDDSLLRWAPDSWNYVGYGHALKSMT